MSEHSTGWRQGPDGNRYPPINEPNLPPRVDAARVAELAALVNSGEVTAAIDEGIDDPELAV